MILCGSCGEISHETKTRKDEFGCCYGVCPRCGSTDIEEARRCPVCGEWTSLDICQECRTRIEEGIAETIAEMMILTDDGRRAAVDVVAEWVERQ